ncbi:Uncharacterised protein [Mycobacteroides abscessus subsp. abscessus]|nr:Uncharacterised protein [Mycobacteroides abscessus subsp. abscessus]
MSLDFYTAEAKSCSIICQYYVLRAVIYFNTI